MDISLLLINEGGGVLQLNRAVEGEGKLAYGGRVYRRAIVAIREKTIVYVDDALPLSANDDMIVRALRRLV